MRTHLSEHESESYSLIRKLLRREECLKEGVDREGVEPLMNVRCHNFHNMLGRLFFWWGGGFEFGFLFYFFFFYLSAFYCIFMSAGKDTVYLT